MGAFKSFSGWVKYSTTKVRAFGGWASSPPAEGISNPFSMEVSIPSIGQTCTGTIPNIDMSVTTGIVS